MNLAPTVHQQYTKFNSTQVYWGFETMAERGGFEPPSPFWGETA